MYGDRKGGRGGGDTRGGGANMGERVASARSLPACVNITSCLYELRGGRTFSRRLYYNFLKASMNSLQGGVILTYKRPQAGDCYTACF